jgi:hypothetical protein
MAKLSVQDLDVRDRLGFLDERLQIIGVDANPDTVFSFAHLSQGAKELLLCLRRPVI